MAAWLHELWLLKPNCLAPSSKYLSSSINNNDSKMFASEIEMGRKLDGSHVFLGVFDYSDHNGNIKMEWHQPSVNHHIE